MGGSSGWVECRDPSLGILGFAKDPAASGGRLMWSGRYAGEGGRATWSYFLKRFSKAVRASIGLAEAGVEVSFSTRTRMEKNVHSLRSSLRGIRSGMGWVHSKRLEVSK